MWCHCERGKDLKHCFLSEGTEDRRHGDEQAIGWLRAAMEMAVETGDTELLQRFLRLEAQVA